jgi:hypothetical protein
MRTGLGILQEAGTAAQPKPRPHLDAGRRRLGRHQSACPRSGCSDVATRRRCVRDMACGSHAPKTATRNQAEASIPELSGCAKSRASRRRPSVRSLLPYWRLTSRNRVGDISITLVAGGSLFLSHEGHLRCRQRWGRIAMTTTLTSTYGARTPEPCCRAWSRVARGG